MKRERELEQRAHSLRTLSEAVGAMKSLSAHHFRGARRAVEPARQYRAAVERMASWVGASLPAGDGPTGLLVIGAELGLCGAYNAQVVEAASERRRQLGPGPTLCVGRRAAVALGRRGVEVRQSYPTPSSVGGVPGVLVTLAGDVLTTYAGEALSSFDIVSSRFVGVGASTPAIDTLLPLRTAKTEAAPTVRYATAAGFESAAIRELLYIVLYERLIDALASEHGARLAATQSAERWLDERLSQLERHLAAARREASTQEMIEIAAGVRARRDEEAGNSWP